MRIYLVERSKIGAIVIMLYKWKDKNFRLLTIVPILFGIISVVISLSSINKSILYPFSSQNLNLSVVVSVLFPLLTVIIFYDVLSSQNQSGIMKKILSEPVSISEIFLSTFLFAFLYVLIMSTSIVIPGFLVSATASEFKSPMEEIRFLAIFFPTLIYGLFWAFLTLSYSARSNSSFKSLGLSVITLVIISYFLEYLLNLGSNFIFRIFGTNPSSSEANSLTGMINAIVPGSSVSNSISILATPTIMRFNLYPYPGSGGTFVYSFNGHISSFLSALYYSMLAITPLAIYVLISLILLYLGIRKIPKLF